MSEPELNIEYVPLADIHPYDGNAKSHPDEQIQQIMKSIEDFGFNDPIAIDENNMIIEGHGRWIAANELGLDKVPTIQLLGLSEEQKKAYILIHNKLTLNSEFDFEKLQNELNSINDIDMSNFGFINSNVDWDSVGDLNESTYNPPEYDMLRCPSCGHVDKKRSFVKVSNDGEDFDK